MSEYININEALKKIKELLYETALNNFTTNREFADACEEIANHRIATWFSFIPTADVVEVVRCRDCRYGPKSLREGVCVNAWCGMWCKENDFCSYAERRSGI